MRAVPPQEPPSGRRAWVSRTRQPGARPSRPVWHRSSASPPACHLPLTSSKPSAACAVKPTVTLFTPGARPAGARRPPSIAGGEAHAAARPARRARAPGAGDWRGAREITPGVVPGRAPSAIAPVAGPPRLPAARPRESLLPGGLGPSPLHAAGGPVPSPPGEGPAEREQGVAIAVAHQRAMPWEPQRGPPGRHPRAARCIVTQQAEGPRGGCFFHPCRACWAVCGWTGSALRWRDVAREG